MEGWLISSNNCLSKTLSVETRVFLKRYRHVLRAFYWKSLRGEGLSLGLSSIRNSCSIAWSGKTQHTPFKVLRLRPQDCLLCRKYLSAGQTNNDKKQPEGKAMFFHQGSEQDRKLLHSMILKPNQLLTPIQRLRGYHNNLWQ